MIIFDRFLCCISLKFFGKFLGWIGTMLSLGIAYAFLLIRSAKSANQVRFFGEKISDESRKKWFYYNSAEFERLQMFACGSFIKVNKPIQIFNFVDFSEIGIVCGVCFVIALIHILLICGIKFVSTKWNDLNREDCHAIILFLEKEPRNPALHNLSHYCDVGCSMLHPEILQPLDICWRWKCRFHIGNRYLCCQLHHMLVLDALSVLAVWDCENWREKKKTFQERSDLCSPTLSYSQLKVSSATQVNNLHFIITNLEE